MKNKNKIIQELKLSVDEDISEKLEKLMAYATLGAICTGMMICLATQISFMGSEFQKMCAMMAALLGTGTIKKSIKHSLGIKYDKLSLKHLNKVETEGIKKSDRLDEKRYNKIEQLSDCIKKSKKKVIIEKIVEVLLAIGVTFTAMSSIFFKNHLLISLASLAGLIGTMIKKTLDEKELYELETRCENLENDLYLGDYFAVVEEDKQEEKIKEQETTRTKNPVKINEKRFIDYMQDEKPKVKQKIIERK